MTKVAVAPGEAQAQKLFGLSAEKVREAWDELTPREQEACALYAVGLGNTKIAEQLGISTKTLDIHRSNICRKLGKTRPWGIARYYFMAQLLRLEHKEPDRGNPSDTGR